MPHFRIEFGNQNFVDLAEQADYSFPHPIQRWVMPVLITHMRDGRMTDARVMGTCFMIAPGLAVTAKHVLTDDFDFIVGSDVGPADRGVAVAFATDEPMPRQDKVWGGLLQVDKIVANPDHDLALMRYAAPKIHGRFPTLPAVRLTLDPPQVGEQVLVLGYSESSSAFRPPNTVELKQKARASRGVIQERHIPGRGPLLMNFPAITGDYPSGGGMSGGPVLTRDGSVCAAVCRALPPSLDDELWTSSASLLAYLFTMEVEVSLDGGVPCTHSVLELAELGAIPTDGSHRRFQLTKRTDGKIDFDWRFLF
jgi:hypothetical protein